MSLFSINIYLVMVCTGAVDERLHVLVANVGPRPVAEDVVQDVVLQAVQCPRDVVPALQTTVLDVPVYVPEEG